MRPPSPLAALLLGAAVLGLPGCAPNPRLASAPEARSAELLSSRPAPVGRTCRVTGFPETLPAAEQLVDREALLADLAGLAPAPVSRDGTPYVLLSMGYDRFGINVRRAVIEHDVGAAVADSVQKLVFAHRRTLDEGDHDWGVRLRVSLVEGGGRLEVGRMEVCAPRPRDSLLAMAAESPFTGGTRVRGGYRESTVWVRLQVGPNGTVTGAAVERGIVAGMALEQRIFDHVRSLFFEPALQDGQPVSGTISIPVLVRER